MCPTGPICPSTATDLNHIEPIKNPLYKCASVWHTHLLTTWSSFRGKTVSIGHLDPVSLYVANPATQVANDSPCWSLICVRTKDVWHGPLTQLSHSSLSVCVSVSFLLSGSAVNGQWDVLNNASHFCIQTTIQVPCLNRASGRPGVNFLCAVVYPPAFVALSFKRGVVVHPYCMTNRPLYYAW